MQILMQEIQKLETVYKIHYMLMKKLKTLENIFEAFDRKEDNFLDYEELKKGFSIFFNYKNEENIILFLNYFDLVKFPIFLYFKLIG